MAADRYRRGPGPRQVGELEPAARSLYQQVAVLRRAQEPIPGHDRLGISGAYTHRGRDPVALDREVGQVPISREGHGLAAPDPVESLRRCADRHEPGTDVDPRTGPGRARSEDADGGAARHPSDRVSSRHGQRLIAWTEAPQDRRGDAGAHARRDADPPRMHLVAVDQFLGVLWSSGPDTAVSAARSQIHMRAPSPSGAEVIRNPVRPVSTAPLDAPDGVCRWTMTTAAMANTTMSSAADRRAPRALGVLLGERGRRSVDVGAGLVGARREEARRRNADRCRRRSCPTSRIAGRLSWSRHRQRGTDRPRLATGRGQFQQPSAVGQQRVADQGRAGAGQRRRARATVGAGSSAARHHGRGRPTAGCRCRRCAVPSARREPARARPPRRR